MSEVIRLSGAKQPGRPAYTDSDKNIPHAEHKRRGKDGAVQTACSKTEG